MGGKPARNVDAATSEATVLYMRWNSYQLADFPAWAAAEPHLARSRYRLMQEVKFLLVNPNPRATADQVPDTVFDGIYHFMLRAAKGCERE